MRDSFTNLAIAHTVITVPYAVRMLTSSLIGLDISVEEAAMNLGANELTTFIRITLPSLKPGIAASVIFTLATSFQNVDTSVFLTTGLPLFPTALLSYLRGNFDPTIAAGSTLVITASFLMIFALDRAVGLKKAIF
jgi:putative spermidine/putrescine transport system permease protein